MALCWTLIVLDNEPSERPVSETDTLPDLLSVDVFSVALTVMELLLVVTMSQVTSVDVVNAPSVVTVTVLEPPSGSNVRLSVDTLRYLPS